MNRLKEQVFRQYGDEGAETLERYFAQIEYAAYWCIRMLREEERINSVIPEGIEDVVVERDSITELHQVKTRDESRGPWTTSEVLPILCKQYSRRNAFEVDCHFYFASDQMADTKTLLRQGTYGPLYDLKYYLDILHDGQSFTPEEQDRFNQLKTALVPKIRDLMKDDYSVVINDDIASDLLLKTWINTNSLIVRNPNNLAELESALAEISPGAPSYTFVQLCEIYDRIKLLIVRKIITTTTIDSRRITHEDIINCRSQSYSIENGYPNLDLIPGITILDKKARLAGFHVTELPAFHKQKALAERTRRKLENLGLENRIQKLTIALLDCHRVCRHKICREQGKNDNPGPLILSLVKTELPPIIERYFPGAEDVDEQFCIGLLWRETNLCQAWWHGLEPRSCEVQA